MASYAIGSMLRTNNTCELNDIRAQVQADGSITLVGDGTFVGGTPLGGQNASLILVGTMSPSPRIAVDKSPT